MGFSVFYFLRLLSKGDRLLFDIPVTEQKQYLDFLGIAENDFERSYNQYLCQQCFTAKWKRIFLNVISLLILPFVCLFLYFKNLFISRPATTYCDAIGDFNGITEIIPNELSLQFSIDNNVWFRGSCLSKNDLQYLFGLYVKYPFEGYFNLKIIAKIAGYNYMISKYHPKALVVHNEYSFTSSALTNYCNSRNVLHINVMHGEKLYYIRDSFFRFDICYVWNQYYKELFISLRADPMQFVTSLPPSLVIDFDKYYSVDYSADYKYYLAIYTEKELLSIINSMQFAVRAGKKVIYRPHPRYSNLALLESYLDPQCIEYPNKVSILSSVVSTKYAVGSYTTVLNQAFYSGIGIILDDVTFKSQFDKLKEYRYFLSNNDCTKLSDIQ